MPAASLVLSFEGDGSDYRDAVRIDTVGVSHWLTHFRATAEAEGAIGRDGTLIPVRYTALYDLHKRRGRHLRLDFVPRDGQRVAERGPGDSSHKRPLAESYRRNVLDPISALSDIREALRRGAIRPGEHFVLPVFDDERRFDAAVTVASAGGHGRPVRLHLELRPIAGFEDKHGDTSDATPREVELTLSGDPRLLPLTMRVEVAFLPLVAEFDHLCADFARCGNGRR
jgi:Protein of unknown function (DUF3108)